ncbi:MAG: OmpA family protein [Deltaproteobacteria bacterium]|nr:OmpA family protein [Deltaproteobacteria bacterium]
MSGTGAQPIIKKVKKKGHGGGAHGGSWKVAYADFVTAMMAFFLLLWLISMVSEDKRARVSQYFKYFSLFEKSGQSMMMDNQVIKSEIEIMETMDAGDQASEQDGAVTDDISPMGNINAAGILESPVDRLKEELKRQVEEKLANMKDQVLVDIYDGAVRIEIVDKKGGSAMFSSGSRDMTSEGKNALRVIAEGIKDVKGRIAIEGHTDAATYAGSQYSNWELSTERASAARRELENSGMSPDKLIRVAGYAATEPLITEDAYDPRNRRISIRVFPEDVSSSSGSGPVVSGKIVPETDRPDSGEKKTENGIDIDPIDKYLLSK